MYLKEPVVFVVSLSHLGDIIPLINFILDAFFERKRFLKLLLLGDAFFNFSTQIFFFFFFYASTFIVDSLPFFALFFFLSEIYKLRKGGSYFSFFLLGVVLGLKFFNNSEIYEWILSRKYIYRTGARVYRVVIGVSKSFRDKSPVIVPPFPTGGKQNALFPRGGTKFPRSRTWKKEESPPLCGHVREIPKRRL